MGDRPNPPLCDNSSLNFYCLHFGLAPPPKRKIRQSTTYYAGLLGRWDKRIIDQESDVPSIFFFILFIDLGHSKLFILFLQLYNKNKLKGFLQRILQEIMKKKIIGTSDAWLTICLSNPPSDPA